MSGLHRAVFTAMVLIWTLAGSSGMAPANGGDTTLEYPVRMLDAFDADDSCWRGMDANGVWRDELGSTTGARVSPEVWLVGPPPSNVSAVSIPDDHWVHLVFSGRLADSSGPDIILLESGKMGEQALVFVTDGADQEYAAALATAEQSGQQDMSRIELDLSTNPSPFVARGVRIVGVDMGGGSPGFDLASVQARISNQCELKSVCPNPPSGSADIESDVRLSWTPACPNGGQRVYFSDVESQVQSRSAEASCLHLPSDANRCQPPHVQLGRTYYWCVDSLAFQDANVVFAGDVWSFAVADRLVVDDFEEYLTSGLVPGPWECSGWWDAYIGAATSQTCDHFLTLEYYYDDADHSEAVRRFDAPQDWAEHGAAMLQLLLRGTPPSPQIAQMYVSITDGEREQLVPYDATTDIDSDTDWYAWRIALDDFNGVDLSHVQGLTIGIRPGSVQPGLPRWGMISVTEVSLCPASCSLCAASHASCVTLQAQKDAGDGQHGAAQGPTADLNGDCIVDGRDMKLLSGDWLRTPTETLTVATPNEPVLWYTFDGHVNDSAGSANGLLQGRAHFEPGKYGQAIEFTYRGDVVTIPDAARVFAQTSEAITIAFWQYGNDSSHLNDTLCCSDYEYGRSDPVISINLGCWERPGQYRWDCGYPWSIANRVAGHHADTIEWTGRWNHWAFTKDIRVTSNGQKGRMEIYLNGRLYDSRTGTNSPITDLKSFEIGSGWYGRYDGLLDDFRIYNYALSPAEVAWLATNGTGVVEYPTPVAGNLDAAGRVNLHDFALLAAQWLQNTLRP
jgi:hypothetical protein